MHSILIKMFFLCCKLPVYFDWIQKAKEIFFCFTFSYLMLFCDPFSRYWEQNLILCNRVIVIFGNMVTLGFNKHLGIGQICLLSQKFVIAGLNCVENYYLELKILINSSRVFAFISVRYCECSL